jgi:putative transposase
VPVAFEDGELATTDQKACGVPAQCHGCDQGGYGGGRLAVMVVRTLAFVIVRRVLGLVGLGPVPDAKDVEIAVLGHQLMVVRRQVARPRYAPADRMVLAVLARLLPRERWQVFLVTPATLLRWHRELVARRWAYRHTGRGQQGLNPEVVDLVVRMAQKNPRWGYVRVRREALIDRVGVGDLRLRPVVAGR